MWCLVKGFCLKLMCYFPITFFIRYNCATTAPLVLKKLILSCHDKTFLKYKHTEVFIE